MLTFRQLNSLLNTAWDTDFDSKITLQFHEDEDGTSQAVSIYAGPWHNRVKMDQPVPTAHLPTYLTFKLREMKDMYRALKKGYKDLDYMMPLQVSEEGFKILRGPGKGTTVATVKK